MERGVWVSQTQDLRNMWEEGILGAGLSLEKNLPGLTVLLLMFSPSLPGKRGFEKTGKPRTSVSHPAITYPFQDGEVALSDASVGC